VNVKLTKRAERRIERLREAKARAVEHLLEDVRGLEAMLPLPLVDASSFPRYRSPRTLRRPHERHRSRAHREMLCGRPRVD
jgi:hypothetical protein